MVFDSYARLDRNNVTLCLIRIVITARGRKFLMMFDKHCGCEDGKRAQDLIRLAKNVLCAYCRC